MKIMEFFVLVTAIFVAFLPKSYASTITEVLSGSDRGFGFSGLHHAMGCDSMCGSNFSLVSLSTQHTSFFYDNVLDSENFKLYLTLDDKNDSLLTLSGVLDFTVDEGQLIGIIAADFADPNVHADTFFKFAQGTKEIGGVGVPKPNGYSEDLFSLWGANSFAGHLPNSIGFDSNTAVSRQLSCPV